MENIEGKERRAAIVLEDKDCLKQKILRQLLIEGSLGAGRGGQGAVAPEQRAMLKREL